MQSAAPPPLPETATASPLRPPFRHPSRSWRFAGRKTGIEQILRLMWCAARIGLDRGSIELVALLGGNRPALRERWQERSARRLVATLGALKGTFAKAAQFAAIRHDLLPEAVTVRLAELRDRVPPLPFRWIRAMVEAELGQPLGSLFECFDPEPFGAASIAQVHRAKLAGGTTVAVKVQYPWLSGSVSADMAIARTGLSIFRAVTKRPAVDFRRILSEFEMGFRSELDFAHEAAVADEIRGNLSGDDGVAVPRVHLSHSSRRILTMEYFETVRVDDTAGLERLGVDPAAVLESIGRAYAKQVFVDGLFHADPHPGNLFVVDEPTARDHPRLLFVDFGLSRRLDTELRDEMRRAIHALIQRDLDGFIDGMQRMGMIAPGAEPAVRSAVVHMFDRFSASGALQIAGSQVLGLKDEAKALLQQTEGLQLPNDLLLYAKTLSYVFALGEQIAPEHDLMKLLLPYLLRYLAQKPNAAMDDGVAPTDPSVVV
jgi:predicted unusual protein kinase regulating ubiquinone biosynthesis (AarF/ABC1/UbiB family)